MNDPQLLGYWIIFGTLMSLLILIFIGSIIYDGFKRREFERGYKGDGRKTWDKYPVSYSWDTKNDVPEVQSLETEQSGQVLIGKD